MERLGYGLAQPGHLDGQEHLRLSSEVCGAQRGSAPRA
jgi:hypothetical protein